MLGNAPGIVFKKVRASTLLVHFSIAFQKTNISLYNPEATIPHEPPTLK